MPNLLEESEVRVPHATSQYEEEKERPDFSNRKFKFWTLISQDFELIFSEIGNSEYFDEQ